MSKLTDKDIECLREHLKPLLEILKKLDNEGVVKTTTPKSKKETKKEKLNRYLKIIEEKEARKISNRNK